METEKKPLSDAGTLRVIADWFESEQQRTRAAWPELPARIPQDLRRIADSLEPAAAPIPTNTPAEATTPKGRRVQFWNNKYGPASPVCWFKWGDVKGFLETGGVTQPWNKCVPESGLVANEWPGVLDHLDAIDAFITAQESAKVDSAPEPPKPPRFDHTTWPLEAWVRRKGEFVAMLYPVVVTTLGLTFLTAAATWPQLASDWEMTTDGGKKWRDCVP